MKSFFILFIILFLPLKSYADCFTGFACSIEDLNIRELQQKQQVISFINSYFDRQVKEINYTSKKLDIKEYRDIFVFNKPF